MGKTCYNQILQPDSVLQGGEEKKKKKVVYLVRSRFCFEDQACIPCQLRDEKNALCPTFLMLSWGESVGPLPAAQSTK